MLNYTNPMVLLCRAMQIDNTLNGHDMEGDDFFVAARPGADDPGSREDERTGRREDRKGYDLAPIAEQIARCQFAVDRFDRFSRKP